MIGTIKLSRTVTLAQNGKTYEKGLHTLPDDEARLVLFTGYATTLADEFVKEAIQETAKNPPLSLKLEPKSVFVPKQSVSKLKKKSK